MQWLRVSLLLALVLASAHLPPVVAASEGAHAQEVTTYCPVNIAAAVECPADRPVCCSHFASIWCCPVDEVGGCEACVASQTSVGFEIAQGNMMLGMMCASLILMMGSIITSSIGRQCAWRLERHRVMTEYESRQALRRKEARDFKRELEETEVRDVPEAEACVICCARFLDCALIPCGHVCSCRFCAKRLKECPVCRAAVEECYRLPDYLIHQLATLQEGAGGGGEEGPEATTAPPREEGPDSSREESREERGEERVEEEVVVVVPELRRAPGPREGPPDWVTNNKSSRESDIVVIRRHGDGDDDDDRDGGIELALRSERQGSHCAEQQLPGGGAARKLTGNDQATTPTPVVTSAASATTTSSSRWSRHAYSRVAVVDVHSHPDERNSGSDARAEGR